MNIKTIVRILSGLIAIALAYFIFESIMEPVRFENLKQKKEAEVVSRIKEIRDVELAYRSVYQKFCGNLDSLILFLREGQLPTVKKTGEIPDTLTEAQALKMGLIQRDTIFDDAYDVLFPNHTEVEKERHLSVLKYIPFTNRTKEFEVSANFITRSNVQIPVVEIKAPITSYLFEPEYKQLVINHAKRTVDLDRYPGIMFGSMTDPHTEGNWE